MTDKRLTAQDVMYAGGCPSGMRRWFTARADDLPQGVDLRYFLTHGLSYALVIKLDDAFLNRAMAMKEKVNG